MYKHNTVKLLLKIIIAQLKVNSACFIMHINMYFLKSINALQNETSLENVWS